jgi:hypothetical protein
MDSGRFVGERFAEDSLQQHDCPPSVSTNIFVVGIPLPPPEQQAAQVVTYLFLPE